MSSFPKSKRDSLTILADILKSLTVSTSSRKMSLVYKANLNFERIKRYLDLLLATGLVEAVDSGEDGRRYRITKKGRDFITDYNRLTEALSVASQDAAPSLLSAMN